MRQLFMETKTFDVFVYQDESGREPFVEWLKTLERSDRARILTRLDRVEQGNLGDHKYISEKLYELRFQYGPGYRVYFGKEKSIIILILAGGTKASQKKDIKRAQKYWSAFRMEDI